MATQKLKMYRPIISNRLTQPWGANLACIYNSGKVVAKKGGRCPRGSIEFYTSIGMKGHNGLDLKAYHGEPVYHCAMFDGIMKIEKDFSGGIGVDVISRNPVEVTFWKGSQKTVYIGHIKIRYWHLKAPVGWDGKVVKFGEQIGLADNTGNSSGDHLHLGAKKCTKNGTSTDGGNGYNGAFDFTSHIDLSIDAKTAADFLKIPPPPLSPQEIREIKTQISLLTKLVNLLLELKRRL